VRIQLELRRASDEATLWVSPKAERELKDVFAIQSEVAEEVARVLQDPRQQGQLWRCTFHHEGTASIRFVSQSQGADGRGLRSARSCKPVR